MANIHPTAVVHPEAVIAKDVIIGPFCVINAQVEIGEGCVFKSHNFVEGPTKIGKNNKFGAFCHIGTDPYHLKSTNEDNNGRLEIGDNNYFGSEIVVNRGMMAFSTCTRIGNNCVFYDRCTIAHDCQVGDYIIASSTVLFAGHVVVDSYSVFGAVTGMLQFCRIGQGSMVTSYCGTPGDILPYALISLYTSSDRRQEPRLRGINLIGLKRRNISNDRVRKLSAYYNKLRKLSPEIGGVRARMASIKDNLEMTPEIEACYKFAEDKSRHHPLVDFPHERPKPKISSTASPLIW